MPRQIADHTRRQRSDRIVAVREAAHAIVAYFIGYRIRRPALMPGHTPLKFEHVRAASDKVRGIRRAENVILICYAGPMAQRRFAPKSHWRQDGAREFRTAARLLGEIAGDHAWFRERHEQWLRKTAESLVERYWREINFLAEDLVRYRSLDKNGVRVSIARSLGMTPAEIKRALAA